MNLLPAEVASMTARIFTLLWVALLAVSGFAQERTTNDSLELLVKEHMTEVKGEPGRWVGSYSGLPVMVMTDPSHDRMRVMTPIMEVGDKPDAAELQRCMEANFASALDGRYALYKGVLWAVFVHPLSEFRGGRFESVLKQVTSLATSHGSTYSSGELKFAPEEKKPEPAAEEDTVGTAI